MILNLLNGKYGTLRQRIMFLLLALALVGIYFLLSGPYFYWKGKLSSLWVAGMLWLNAFLAFVHFSLFVQQLVRAGKQVHQGERNESPTEEDAILGKRTPKGFADYGDKIWNDPYEPLPLEEIMQQLDELTYDNLVEQMQLWKRKGNPKAADWFLNPLKKWTRSHYWKAHHNELRFVKMKEVKTWLPRPKENTSPIA